MHGGLVLLPSETNAAVIKWVICERAQAARQFHHSVAPSPLTLAVGPLGLNTIRAPSPVCVHPDHAKWAALRILFWRVK